MAFDSWLVDGAWVLVAQAAVLLGLGVNQWLRCHGALRLPALRRQHLTVSQTGFAHG